MTIEITGNWKKGFAYDVHTLDSVYIGPDQFGHDRWKNTRSDMGELVYQLKYGQDKSVIGKIIDLLDKFKSIEKFDAIIPVPSTKKNRSFQPVDEVALELGKRKNVKVLLNVFKKTAGGSELKNIDDPAKREEALENAISLSGDYDISGEKVLLIDDLYRSGTTLTLVTDILYKQAKVDSVSVLTMTKTRSNR